MGEKRKASLRDLWVFRDAFTPRVPVSDRQLCQCPHCGCGFQFRDWEYSNEAAYCEDCEDHHAGFICPNPECEEVMGAAGQSNGQIIVVDEPDGENA